ncbi:MAG TPA: hypothetical protein VK470_11955, partial [Bacteroidota bacterium]|nr:hypothetical protein [Bacteroidota bacterium]
MAVRLFGLIIMTCLIVVCASGADRIVFTEKFGQVEVGGPFAGAEFHRSRPLPSRISFYYPVANSIDLSTGYWERGESAPMTLAVSIDSGAVLPLGIGGWEYVLSPHTVTFRSANDTMRCSIRYEFCLTEPAMAVTYTIANSSTQTRLFDVRTQSSMILRTCQTYARKISPVTGVESPVSAVIARFNDADTDSTSVFVVNAGAPPYDISVEPGTAAG